MNAVEMRAAPAGETAVLPERQFTVLDAAFSGYYVLLIACHLAAARLAVGWPSAAVTDGLASAYLLALSTHRAWRPLVLRLLTLGLVAGLCELGTDAAGEGIAHSLVYPAGVPLLWASPFFMPISWMVTLAWLGYLSVRLRSLSAYVPIWMSLALVGLSGAITLPFYEEMAGPAGWWRYVSSHDIGYIPVYVLVFEGAVSALIPLVTAGLLRRSLGHAAVCGLEVGIWMPAAAFLAWFSLGR